MTDPHRSTRTTVEFAHPFVLKQGDDPLPPGTYDIETDEELIPNLSFIAYRRVRTTLTSPVTQRGVTLQRQVHDIEPSALEAALASDRSLGPPERVSPSNGKSDDHVMSVSDSNRTDASARAAPRGSRSPLAQFRKHNLISASLVIIPLLIIAVLAFITWYRPPY